MKPTRRVRRRKQTRRKRRGGKKLGEGMYGFVVDPAIPCEGKDTSGYVSKVLNPKESQYDTPESFLTKTKSNPVFAKLKEIDPEQKEFIYAEFCENVGEPSEENKADGVTNENKKYSYLLKRGGKSLEQEFKEEASKYIPKIVATSVELEKAIQLMPQAHQEYMNVGVDHLKPVIQKIVAYLKPIVNRVLELRDKLYANGISQGDLHPGNVLRMDDGTLRIIDFDGTQMFDPKNPNRHIADFKDEDGVMFIEGAAWLIVTKNERDTADLGLSILQGKVVQKVVDMLQA